MAPAPKTGDGGEGRGTRRRKLAASPTTSLSEIYEPKPSMLNRSILANLHNDVNKYGYLDRQFRTTVDTEAIADSLSYCLWPPVPDDSCHMSHNGDPAWKVMPNLERRLDAAQPDLAMANKRGSGPRDQRTVAAAYGFGN